MIGKIAGRGMAVWTLTFITEMTKALAWPVVVGFVALIARKPVAVLLEGLRLQKLKAAGVGV